VVVKAGRNLTINPNAFVQSTSGSLTATAGGSFTMTESPGALGDEFITNHGAIALSAGPGGVMTLDSSGTTAVSSSGGNITLSADLLHIDKVVSAGAGNVLIQPVTAGQPISLGSVTGGLSLGNADLGEVGAKTLTIGNGNAGEVFLAGLIAPTPGINLTLNTGSGLTATGSTITIGSGVLTIDFDGNGLGATAEFERRHGDRRLGAGGRRRRQRHLCQRQFT
jgi:hypothetical protein